MPEFDPETALALWHRIIKRRHIIPLSRALRLKLTDDEIAYIDLFSNLYRAIAAVSGKPIVIDSGKVAYHSALMQWAGERIQWREVHLVRDPRAVAFSRQRIKQNTNVTDGKALMVRHGPMRVSGRWLWANSLIWASRRKNTPTTRVVYETLADFPAAEMTRLTHTLDLTSQAEAEKTFKPLETGSYMPPAGVAFSGNSSRFDRKQTKIRPDDEWKTSLPTHDRRVVTVLTWPLRGLFRPQHPDSTQNRFSER
ncbi:hypothetical protein ACERZ8_21345 [Tateyamaria armeniaca]|uniref:Sulfotransferase family protein n=1 Tax=Tateyamaria armeniaca TaxID=2518930 RepID=A0ABW8V2A3_9RHOB